MLNIIIFGAPGSGKGTQSELIIEKYGLHHISTGDILREEIEQQTALGIIADEYISEGKLVPDHLILDMFADELAKHPNTKGYIYDGFPRTVEQAKELDNMLRERKTAISAAISLSVDDEELIKRLLKRGEISGRKDDNLETITKRLAVFKEQTDPLKEFYTKKGLLVKVKGDDTVEEVFEGIVATIDRLIDK